MIADPDPCLWIMDPDPDSDPDPQTEHSVTAAGLSDWTILKKKLRYGDILVKKVRSGSRTIISDPDLTKSSLGARLVVWCAALPDYLVPGWEPVPGNLCPLAGEGRGRGHATGLLPQQVLCIVETGTPSHHYWGGLICPKLFFCRTHYTVPVQYPYLKSHDPKKKWRKW